MVALVKVLFIWLRARVSGVWASNYREYFDEVRLARIW